MADMTDEIQTAGVAEDEFVRLPPERPTNAGDADHRHLQALLVERDWIGRPMAALCLAVPLEEVAHPAAELMFPVFGVPNYVVDPDTEDREHQLRRQMGDLFERDSDARGGHRSSDPGAFYEQCLEMVMIRIARVRRALRSREHELVFGYTRGLDLIGHVTHSRSALQQRAYEELNEFVGELREDLGEEDELLLVSDHGLQDGLHTHEAMVAATEERLIADVSGVADLRGAIERELGRVDHVPERRVRGEHDIASGEAVKDQLADLGYI